MASPIHLPGSLHEPRLWSSQSKKAGTQGGLCLQMKIQNSALKDRLTCEVNFFWKMNKSQVIMKVDLAALFMGEEVSC